MDLNEPGCEALLPFRFAPQVSVSERPMSTQESVLASPQRSTFWAEARDFAASLYCRWFHRDISRPVNGKYRCWECLREYDLEW